MSVLTTTMKCDRCEKTFEVEGSHYPHVISIGMYDQYDLCPDCFKDLYDFIREKKEEN